MLFRTDQTPALLSFLMPGLGQLFQRRPQVTAVFFVVFCALMLGAKTRYALPVWAMVSALEAMRRRVPGPAGAPKNRTGLYATVGIVGFLCWFGFFASVVYEPYLPPILKQP